MFDNAVVLVAESDARLRGFLAAQLDADAAIVHAAADQAEARARAAALQPDALVLGGLETPAAAMALLRGIRASGGLRGEPSADLPVVVLADAEDDLAALRAFDAGADDVAPRRVVYPLLRARLRVLLGQSGSRRSPSSVRRIGGLELDAAAREVRLHGQLVDLSAKELALLSALMADPSRVFTKDELLRDVWGYRAAGRTRTLDSHACRLRRKLAVHGDVFVVNVWGVGYRLTDRAVTELRAVA